MNRNKLRESIHMSKERETSCIHDQELNYRFKLSDIMIEYASRLNNMKAIKQISKSSNDLDFFDLNIKNINGKAISKRFYIPHDSFSINELNWIYKEIFCHQIINPHAYLFDKISIMPGDVVIDAGACEGFFILVAIELMGDGKVIAFEPIKKIRNGLEETFQEEITKSKVIVEPYGLSNSVKESQLSYIEGAISSASNKDTGVYKENILLTTLDNCYLNQKIDFIKMDIEGEEIKAIEGAKEIIRKYKPKLSIAVYHSYENAYKIKQMIKSYRNDYIVEFRGYYSWKKPARPYLLVAY